MSEKLADLGVNKGETVAIDLSTVTGVLTYYTQLLIEGAKDNLEADGSNASYKLSQSIRTNFEVRIEKFGMVYTAQIIMEDYWIDVEKGREPGRQPPTEAIIKWIGQKEGFKLRGLDKLGDLRERGKNKLKPYTYEDILHANAFGIARKIGLKGTRGTGFLSKVLTQEFYNNLNRDLGKALQKDVEVDIKIMVDTKELTAEGTKRF